MACAGLHAPRLLGQGARNMRVLQLWFLNNAFTTQAVVTLRAQYRMSADIMAVPNALVYNGALAAGSLAVALRALHLPQLATSAMPLWLQKVCWAVTWQASSSSC
jgi:AAA domain